MSRSAKTITMVLGVVYTLVGLLGFVLPSPLLGVFAVDTPHNIVHLLLGVLGIGAAYSDMSRLYCQVFGVALLLLAVVGFLFTGGQGTLFGILHMNLADHLLHLVSGAVLAYFGFVAQRNSLSATR